MHIYPEPTWPLLWLEFRPCFEGLTFDYRGQLVCQVTFGIPSSFNLPHFWWIQPRRCKNSLKLTAKAPENWETFLPFWKGLFSGATADGRNFAPVEVKVVYSMIYKVLAPSQVVIAGFLNHQQYVKEGIGYMSQYCPNPYPPRTPWPSAHCSFGSCGSLSWNFWNVETGKGIILLKKKPENGNEIWLDVDMNSPTQ